MDFFAKIFLILYTPFENSTTRIAILHKLQFGFFFTFQFHFPQEISDMVVPSQNPPQRDRYGEVEEAKSQTTRRCHGNRNLQSCQRVAR